MTSIVSAAPRGQPKKLWDNIAPYVAPPLAGGMAVILVFRDLILKSAEQQGLFKTRVSWSQALKEGGKAAPTLGLTIGLQMILQGQVEQKLQDKLGKGTLSCALTSAAIVGLFSAPVLAVFNGRTAGLTLRESLRNHPVRQCSVLAVQEIAFVGGVSVGKILGAFMRSKLGDHTAIDYAAAFLSGAAGSIIGHPANTAVTRWQKGLQVELGRQLFWGTAKKARAIGCFSLLYKGIQELLKPAS